MRLAVLASHTGTILQAIIDACEAGTLDASLVLVASNNSSSGAMTRARAHGVPTAHISGTTHPTPDALDHAMLDALQAANADWILLAGYMKKLGPATLTAFSGRMINTHPALLPKFGGQGFFGRNVHQAVLAAGETESGASVHFVSAEYDEGPVLAQVRVPVLSNDSVDDLEERVKVAERQLVVNTLRELAAGRVGGAAAQASGVSAERG